MIIKILSTSNKKSQERQVIESKLSQCIQLNADYREAYQKIKNKNVSSFVRIGILNISLKVVKKAKVFSFSEKYIFGRFDSFCTRLSNLLKMFSTINQFTSLFNSRTEVCGKKTRTVFCKKFSAKRLPQRQINADGIGGK